MQGHMDVPQKLKPFLAPRVLIGVGGLVILVLVGLLSFGLPSFDERDLSAGDVPEFDLSVVRESGTVPAIFAPVVPETLAEQTAAERKQIFFRLLLPLIAKANAEVRAERATVIAGEASPTLFAKYKVEPGDLERLKRRVDVIPASLVVAQAALESGWGTSRFAQEAQNLFGMRSYNPDTPGLAPKEAEGFKVIAFGDLMAGVAAYLRNLNTHSAYRDLCARRAEVRAQEKPLSGMALSYHLQQYSEVPEIYGTRLRTLMRRDRLADFDGVTLGPPSHAALGAGSRPSS